MEQCQWQLQLWYWKTAFVSGWYPFAGVPHVMDLDFVQFCPFFSIHVSDLREEVCLGKKARGSGSTTLVVKSPLLSKKCCAIGGYLSVWILSFNALMKFCQLFNVFDDECMHAHRKHRLSDVCKPCWQGSCELPRHFAIFKALRDKYSNSEPIRKRFFFFRLKCFSTFYSSSIVLGRFSSVKQVSENF